jgi:hypothetical protein
MLARKQSLRYINNKIMLNQKVLALLSLMRKITLLQKNGKNMYIFLNYYWSHKCECGAAVESQIGKLEIAGSIPTSAV